MVRDHVIPTLGMHVVVLNTVSMAGGVVGTWLDKVRECHYYEPWLGLMNLAVGRSGNQMTGGVVIGVVNVVGETAEIAMG